MKNAAQPGLNLQGCITLVLQYWDAEKANVEMAEAGKSEGDDTNADGQGRKLTAAETRRMAKMRSHVLWGQFVRRWTLLTTMNAETEDYVELQLKAGLPYVRKQLYCQVNVAVAAGNPWKHLLDHRFANVKDFKQGQRYLGRAMMLQSDGDVPDNWEGWKAPAKLVQQLVEGKITEINFEQVYAELCKAPSRPLPASVVSLFTSSARYMNPAWQRVVVKLGGKILTAWGLNDTAVREGSFEQMVDDH